MKRTIGVKSQSVETSGITKDYKEAICEYIWNGFEANATRISISFTQNELGGISELCISDNGDGIDLASIDDTFGAFLASQKNNSPYQIKSKANKGKGRFAGFAFAEGICWSTVFSDGKINKQYTISIQSENKNEYEPSELLETELPTGTVVTFSGVDGLKPEQVTLEALEDTLLKGFAWYLYLNKNRKVEIIIDNKKLDYSKYINTEFSIDRRVAIDGVGLLISVIVWEEKISEKFCTYYMDSNGVIKGTDTTTFNRNTVNFNHSVFVQSIYFNENGGISLSTINDTDDTQISTEDLAKDRSFLRKVKHEIQETINEVLSSYLAKQADKAIQGMIDRKSFPHFADDVCSQYQKKELISVAKELYKLDSQIFYRLKPVQEKSLLGFLNLLLQSEERENIMRIIEEIVQLTPDQRSNFADVLRKTKLSNVVDTIKFIEDRYRIIESLKHILFELTDYANERNHVQKIVEQHYWLFGEQYNLVTADQRMQRALEQYLHLLYGASAPDAALSPDDDEIRRMDIFLCGARKVEDSTGDDIQENLIIELKAPKIVLSKKVLRQIEDYMDFVRKQPQFNTQLCRWKFMAVCSSVDDDVKARYASNKAMGKKGLVLSVDNYELYALTWADVFKSFDLRHSFMLEKLKVDQEAIAAEIAQQTNAETNREKADSLVSKALEIAMT